MTVQTWLWLTLFAMSLGAAAILFTAKRRTPEEETDGILHGIVPLIAAASYLAMACGQGAIRLPLGADPAAQWDFYFARYIDWTFTTPILLYALATDAMHSGMRRHGAVFGMLAADVLMIAAALFFGASATAWIKWTWYAVSCGAFLGVYYVIWVPLLEESRREREDVRAAFRRNAAFLSVVWLIYPLVLIVGTDGLKLVSPVLTTALIAVLDVVAKVVFGLMAVGERARIVDRDLHETRPVRRSAPSLAPAE
ncbi:bacteriorhodopsin [Methylobacterium sp. WSM2598]|uniref:bacteriorhodopsin n=1 Tax=Methylobacterium sp. WSM2598 TaxID=398261 RepID=UPI00037AEA22|nr:bacteriorhodopsin [Methylobacterium sp. WSM2598]